MNNRWANQYALRYAVGTVVGAIIVCCLFLRLPEKIREQVPAMDAWGKIVILGAVGLAFCYLASAPLFVMHVCRGFFLRKDCPKSYLWDAIIGIAGALIAPLTAFVIVGDFSLSIPFIAAAFFSAISVIQVIALWTINNNREFLLNFYETLSAKREKDKSDLVTSYRDMREHGNAFAIVLFEVFLGATLFGLADFVSDEMPLNVICSIGLLVVGIWIVPASWALYTAARLEIDFAGK